MGAEFLFWELEEKKATETQSSRRRKREMIEKKENQPRKTLCPPGYGRHGREENPHSVKTGAP
jgi:hypothetical protein